MLSTTVSTIRSIKTGSLVLATLLAASLPAVAGDYTSTASSKDKNPIVQPPPAEPRFYVDLMAGGEFDYHATKFISNGSAQFGTFGVDNLPAKIESRDFTSTHDVASVNGRLQLGYKVLPYLSIFAGFTYTHSDGDNSRRLGYVTDASGAFGTAGGRYDLYAGITEYQAYSGMGGFKLGLPRTILDLIHAPKAIKPYLSVSAGGKYLDGQDIYLYSGASSGVGVGHVVNSGFLPLYDSGWVFTGEASLGYDVQLTRNFGIILENGYGYDTKPERGSLPGTIHGTNNSGDRFYSNVYLGGKVSF